MDITHTFIGDLVVELRSPAWAGSATIVRDAVTPWGLPFDPATVRTVGETLLQNLLGGESNQLSQAARAHLAGQFAALRTQSAVQQASALAALVSTESAMPELTNEPVPTTVVAYDLEGPTVHPAYAFDGITVDAEVWTARYVDNVLFPIVAPRAPQAWRSGRGARTRRKGSGSNGSRPWPTTRSRCRATLANRSPRTWP